MKPVLPHPILQFLKTAPYLPPFDMIERCQKGTASARERMLADAYLVRSASDDHQSITAIETDTLSDEAVTAEIDKLNRLPDVAADHRKTLRLAFRNIEPYQIWSTRNRQYTLFAEELHTFYPYLVMIAQPPRSYKEKHAVIRVQPISFITEFASEGDILTDDPSLLGAPFLIETWNEQPMLDSGLLEYVCKINPQQAKTVKDRNLSSEEREFISQFRYDEIENTEYLRKPVMSLLSYYEQHDQEYCVIRIDGNPNFLTGQSVHAADSYDWALAAKTGKPSVAGNGSVYWKGSLNGVSCEMTIQPSEQFSDLILRSDSVELKLYDQEMNPVLPESILSEKNRCIAVYKGLKDIVYLIGIEQTGRIQFTLKLNHTIGETRP